MELNIAVIGKSGVGKSALINYLVGENLCETSAGLPVTKKGFHVYDTLIKGRKIKIYDSWGLEVSSYQTWLSEFQLFYASHNASQTVNHWLHLVIYCIDASKGRIEDADITMIHNLLNESLNVKVVLTKVGLIDEGTEQELKNFINQELNSKVEIISVNSIEQNLMGMNIETFGREQVVEALERDLTKLLRIKRIERCKYLLSQKVLYYDDIIRGAEVKVENIGFIDYCNKRLINIDLKLIMDTYTVEKRSIWKEFINYIEDFIEANWKKIIPLVILSLIFVKLFNMVTNTGAWSFIGILSIVAAIPTAIAIIMGLIHIYTDLPQRNESELVMHFPSSPTLIDTLFKKSIKKANKKEAQKFRNQWKENIYGNNYLSEDIQSYIEEHVDKTYIDK